MSPFPPSRSDVPAADDAAIRVMLVDDSAVVRGMITRVLEADPAIRVVTSAQNGEVAVGAVSKTRPDVILLDVEMPVMDGLTALPKLLAAHPSARIVMCSSLTEKGATITLQAMRLGAVECIAKPTSRDTGVGSTFHRQLLDIVKGLGVAPGRKAAIAARPAAAPSSTPASVGGGRAPLFTPPGQPKTFSLRNDSMAYKGKPALVAIGSSTGGPQALFEVTKSLKGLDVPIVITQHMPATFTRILAQHIQQQSGIPTQEGSEGMRIEAGHAYVAPGGLHMEIIERDGKPVIRLSDAPPENFCKPAVDPMFRSLVKLYGRKVLGIILTGMGSDGLKGGQMLVEAGGRLIAQDEATSVVWGMPGAAAMSGICSAVLPLKDIGPW
ncbi:MAG TPA: chemotaxis response regulator protein-glutamate methylesterase, partial [Alphaproteobacteria bacterium]|nr:chemotaxis response regulator protein-glutamate methylesterase [Alphaproteobacteria bacterium]